MNFSSALYGIYRRTMPRTELDPYERRQRDQDEAWDLRNEALVDALDLMIGKLMRLRHPIEIGQKTFAKGTAFYVRGRVRDTYLVTQLTDKSLTTVIAARDLKRAKSDE